MRLIPRDVIESYGYWAVLVGGVLEGETVFIAAGYAVSQDYLAPLPTFIAAVTGGSLGDFLYFTLGRLFGARLIRRFAFLRRLRARAVLFLRRWGRATAGLTRFAYGLRIILPMTIGAARFPGAAFILYNLIGSLAFAGVYLSVGYLFGETLEEVLGTVRRYEKPLLIGLAVAGAVVLGVREWRLYHRRSRRAGGPR
ncbi:MAG: DedA family protein [Gemmatimonadetes bacterium]|nr:DedA family protein [Gemmatimonadota bacterium]